MELECPEAGRELGPSQSGRQLQFSPRLERNYYTVMSTVYNFIVMVYHM